MLVSKNIISNKKYIVRHVNLVGGKAYNLARLALAGFRVPEFFVISTRVYDRRLSLKENSFTKKLSKTLRTSLPGYELSKVAARSSSPLEDHKNYSFAGLFRSILDLEGPENIYSALWEIWGSARTASVKNYSIKFSIDRDISVAVVLQKMIHAKISGVIFTNNPLDKSANDILIEIVEGSCEKLVSGERSPVQVVVNKSDGTCKTLDRCQQPEPLASFLKNQANITKLVQISREIERLFGAPQDIEWSFDGRDFWLLQSRPISTLSDNPSVRVDDLGIKWSNYFFAERFVRPLSRLGWSVLQPAIRKTALQAPLWYLGYSHLCKSVRLELIDGIPYTQLESYKKLYAHLPRSLISDDKKTTLELEGEWKKLSFRRFVSIFFRLLIRDFSWIPPYNLWQWTNFQRSMEAKTGRILTGLNDCETIECFNILKATLLWSERFLAIHRWSITFADIFIALLKKFVRFLNTKSSIHFEHLVGGQENATMRTNKSLLRLDPTDADDLNRFCMEYGHRSESLDIACPTWGEEKEHIEQMSAMLKKGRTRFIENQRQNEFLREKAQQEIFSCIKSHKFLYRSVLRGSFKLLFHYTSQFLLLRENQRDVWQKILRISRYSALRVAQYLAANGKLAHADDIFYLDISEVQLLMRQRNPKAIGLVKTRRQLFEELNKKYTKTDSMRRDSMPGRESHVLSGIGVSQGQITGRARIALNYSEAMQGQSGEILVVPAADPAWSPVFGVISGLVTERGGILSHASIVAREFRLPAITNVANATTKIKNGDILQMDGVNGRLTVVERGNGEG